MGSTACCRTNHVVLAGSGSVRSGPVPPCTRCGGIQRLASVAIGQMLSDIHRRAREGAATSLSCSWGRNVVPGAPLAQVCFSPRKSGARFVIVKSRPRTITGLPRSSAPIHAALPAILSTWEGHVPALVSSSAAAS